MAAELHDLVDCKQFREAYPLIAPDIRIKLIDAAPTILSTFDKRLAEYAAAKFKRAVGPFLTVNARYGLLGSQCQGIEVLTSRKIKRLDTWSIETEQDGTSASS